MRRRKFIGLSAYSVAATGIPVLKGCKQQLANKAIAQPPFLSYMMDVKTLKETGDAYLKLVPSEKSVKTLEEKLLDNGSTTGSANAAIVHSFFDKKIKEDFETGKTVVLNGWVLSVTEARQCALFALSQ